MFRLPKSRIVLFVLLSMITAFAYHHWYLPRFHAQSELASNSPQELSTQVQEIIKLDHNSGPAKSELNASSKKESEPCQCLVCLCAVAGVENHMLQTEEPESCGSERTFLESGLAKLDPIFREERAKSPAEFPRSCLTYIMRSTYVEAEGQNSELFASCKDVNSPPQRGARKPCVTKSYVNAVYNTFGDLTDCLSIPARDYLPKLAIESGFHMNIRGGRNETVKRADGTVVKQMTGGDTGIPQFVTQSIDYANEDFARLQREIKSSDRESCQRIAPSIAKLKPMSSDLNRRCGLVTPPENPLQSLFYMMIKYEQDSRALERYMEKPSNDIYARLKRLGLAENSYDKAKLKQMLMVLAYNSGASATVTLLKNYLQFVEQSGRKLDLGDFDIGAESFIYRKINDKTQQLRKLESNTDADWQRRKTEFEKMVVELSHMDIRFKPTAKAITVTEPVVGTYETYRLEFEKGDLSFAAYSMLYQSSGNGGYLSKVRASATSLNKVFKEGVCVPDSYLAL